MPSAAPHHVALGSGTDSEQEVSLLEILDNVLNSGVVIQGSIVISLAGVDLVYVGLNIISGRFQRKLFPLSIKSLFGDLRAALTGKLKHDDLTHYNAVQKAAYLAVIVDIVIVILSGLAVWKSVQFPWLRDLMGGYDNARVVHFFAMSFLVAFFVLHVVMVALVPRSLLLMIRGR